MTYPPSIVGSEKVVLMRTVNIECRRCHAIMPPEEQEYYNALMKGFGPLCAECDKMITFSHNAARLFSGGFKGDAK